ncbi:hypothetical protein [Hyphobacterium indicum]|uniref:hypothetical protein n=1 Tax=Hyphobacterium indicum TaxID=2162714 RepID=UPI000D65073E|nr:hypothetical protein [Hyphobacterium indicum]
MILDNLSRALKTQNWLAAGVEFVIVIAGVVIGFQINAWNEDRAANAAAAQAVTRLRAESEAVVNFWVEDVADAMENDRHRVSLLRALQNARIEPGFEDAVYDGIEGLYFYAAITPPRTVFDELLASGGLSRISDPGANAAVSEYADQLTFITGQLDQFRSNSPDGLSILDRQVFSEIDFSDLTLRRFDFDIASLSEDRVVVSSIVDAVRNQRVFLFFRMGALRTAYEMCEALSAARSETCASAQSGRDQLAAARAYLDEMRQAP